MEINYHYLNRYLEICRYYQLNPPNPEEHYCEKHHIIFLSWIGDKKSGWDSSLASRSLDNANIVLVPVRAHYLLHQIAVKAYPHRRNKAALGMFAKMSNTRLNALTGRQVQRIREEAAKAQSEASRLRVGKLHPQFGKTRSAETKKKIGESRRGKPSPNRDWKIHRFINEDRSICVFGNFFDLKQNANQLFGFSHGSVQVLKEGSYKLVKGWRYLGTAAV